ncbi:hypothetical protein AB0I94_02215 [Streptomyces sp. NPDC050147]|uniref:hypothetical protein n=1 Tax=Streptomyces sp. NPDC050147 TaxID=3155513 RepID=UPI0034438E82
MSVGRLDIDKTAALQPGENTREERRDASRYVLRHAHNRNDLGDLLDALGLNTKAEADR